MDIYTPYKNGYFLPIASYFDQDLNGKRVKLFKNGISEKPYGPLNLILPGGHTGTLTGLVELRADLRTVEEQTYKQVSILVEVAWDEHPDWNHGYCDHDDYCLVDLHMKSDKVHAIWLDLINKNGKKCGNLNELISGNVVLNIKISGPVDPLAKNIGVFTLFPANIKFSKTAFSYPEWARKNKNKKKQGV